MDCVCGCGRELGKKGELVEANLIAAQVALELLVWDKSRASPSPEPGGREGLIARGADCYRRLLSLLHGEVRGNLVDDCRGWLLESAEMRAGLSDLTRERLFGPGPPRVSDVDIQQLNRQHPETSFTMRPTAGPPSLTSELEDANARAEGELVDKLERLCVLREDGLLTNDEFLTAKAHLLP